MLKVVPSGPLQQVDKALHVGMSKYGGWDSSEDSDVYLGAILRHLGKWLGGESLDQKDGHHHLAAIVVRCCQLLDKEL